MTQSSLHTRPDMASFSLLDAHLAFLDMNGAVVWENKPWQGFHKDNMAGMPHVVMGENYMDALVKTAGVFPKIPARDAAAGIRKILGRESDHFFFEYCPDPHSPAQWLSLQAVPAKDGVLVFHTKQPSRTGVPGAEAKKERNLLQQANKMEAIGTLASGIAHDFNNILGGIIGYSELIKEDLEEMGNVDAHILERMDNVMAASIRARNLISQILAFSRSGREDKHPVSVRPLVKEAAQFMRASLPSYIEIQKRLTSASQVVADPTQIHQILMNLCANAKDAMGKNGGTLTIILEDVHLAAADIDSREGAAPGNYVRLSVVDTGCGIEPEHLDHIMEPFFTTKPKGKGTGMGLAVVHGIIRGLDGFIRVSSEKDKGAEFSVYLPAHAMQIRPRNKRAVKAGRPFKGGTEQIVFVDDEELLTRIAKDALPSLGYQVRTFTRSKEALAYFTAHTDRCDLVISDITMPELPGDLLALEMRSLKPDLPVILITGASERMDEVSAKEMGFSALLYKPVTIEKMATTIREVLDGEFKWQMFS